MRVTRVTIDPDVMGGMPCIRGLRIPVATVVAMVADQMTSTEILAELPELEEADVTEACDTQPWVPNEIPSVRTNPRARGRHYLLAERLTATTNPRHSDAHRAPVIEHRADVPVVAAAAWRASE
ncbi:DUF433 domain-containing protein [Mycobacterium tuberculosis]|uniref:DUF433 domain-containing protein n=1 Tax=Mycobacterium tuberculosis TaxID=1773 RepID=UPI00207B3D80|nr:DUF433 domain-containing protein [Mycobacterium tuberculosis]